MRKTMTQIKDYIQFHTSGMDAADYIDAMREIAEWAASKADVEEYGMDAAYLNGEY